MSWGDTFSSAWNSATSAAQAVADRVSQTVAAAENYVSRVIDTVERGAQAIAGAVGSGVSTIVGLAQRAYQAVHDRFSNNGAGGAVQPCPHGQNGGGSNGGKTNPQTQPQPQRVVHIVAVEWLHGSDTTVIGDCEQFVNLPRDAKWLADSGIANIDRLGMSPRFRVRFDQPITSGFQWRIVPVAGGSPAYTGTETGRNGNYTPSSTDWTLGSAPDGIAIMPDAARLVAGGGYKFKIEAKDEHGTVVHSGVITTKRLFWYVLMPMAGLAGAMTAAGPVEAEYAKHHMVLKALPNLSIPMQQNIGSPTDSSTLEGNVTAAVAGNAAAAAKAPYLLRIALTSHLAVKHTGQVQTATNSTVGPGQPDELIGVSNTALLSGQVEAASVWHDIVTGEGWFVSARFIPQGGGAAIAIPQSKVTASGTGQFWDTLTVDVTGLPAGTGNIEVVVDVVDRMRAGLALGGAANICICTRSWWNTDSIADQQQTLVHEMGHKVHMVAAGSGGDPDQVSTQYSGHGHAGSHCYNGCPAGQANYSTPSNESAATCVMFGTSNGHGAFCGNCAPAVKKVDINAGF